MLTREDVQNLFSLLGENSWKHVIDGKYHQFGKHVFDQGLHDKEKTEPGYLQSFEKAWQYAHDHIDEPLTVEFYLELHKILTAHFKGSQTHTRTHARDGGKLRDYMMISNTHAKLSEQRVLALGDSAKALFNKFKIEPRTEFLGVAPFSFEINHNNSWGMKQMLKDIFEHFNQVMASENDGDVLFDTVSELFKILELLHPMEDAQRRLNLIILAKSLAEIGMSPPIFYDPHVSLILTTSEWKEVLISGIKATEKLIIDEAPNPAPIPASPLTVSKILRFAVPVVAATAVALTAAATLKSMQPK